MNKSAVKGYDSIPNKFLMKAIARNLPVIISDERYTSKIINCCYNLANHGHHDWRSSRKFKYAANQSIKKILKHDNHYKQFYDNLSYTERNFLHYLLMCVVEVQMMFN